MLYKQSCYVKKPGLCKPINFVAVANLTKIAISPERFCQCFDTYVVLFVRTPRIKKSLKGDNWLRNLETTADCVVFYAYIM